MADLTEAQKQSYWRYNATLTTILLIVRSHQSSINSLFRLTTAISATKEGQR
jgi:uncharacterized membrane protein